MNTKQLEEIAQQMVAPGKGILAIDESFHTSEKRFKAAGVEHTEENRRLYRQLLVTAPEMERFVSGYIMFDETIRQKTDKGIPFPDVLSAKGILPGIKVDEGKAPFSGSDKETLTKGLDGLADRLQEYLKLGAKFTKWRVAIAVSDTLPSKEAVRINMQNMAQYAKIVQEAGLVPMVEPEILIDGDHTIDRCEEVSTHVWDVLFEELGKAEVHLPGAILKTSMLISGKAATPRAGRQEVAKRTVEALIKHVPSEVAGVVFLSGGQEEIEATEHLNEMHKLDVDLPWPLTFSYGRAIQNPAMEIWAQDIHADVRKAQEALVHRAEANSLASLGKYTPEFK